MMVKMINGASLKVQIFLYYASMNEKSTCTFPDFEQDMTKFDKLGIEKLRKQYENGDSTIWTWEEYKDLFNWAATAESSILAYNHAKEVREELIKEGFLWSKSYTKKKGTITITKTYVGLTNKGKKWAPKYIEKFGKVTITK